MYRKGKSVEGTAPPPNKCLFMPNPGFEKQRAHPIPFSALSQCRLELLGVTEVEGLVRSLPRRAGCWRRQGVA